MISCECLRARECYKRRSEIVMEKQTHPAEHHNLQSPTAGFGAEQLVAAAAAAAPSLCCGCLRRGSNSSRLFGSGISTVEKDLGQK